MATSDAAVRPQQGGIFYGWWIVLVSVLLMATIFGTIINSFSLFIEPVMADIPTINIAQFTIAYSVRRRTPCGGQWQEAQEPTLAPTAAATAAAVGSRSICHRPGLSTCGEADCRDAGRLTNLSESSWRSPPQSRPEPDAVRGSARRRTGAISASHMLLRRVRLSLAGRHSLQS